MTQPLPGFEHLVTGTEVKEETTPVKSFHISYTVQADLKLEHIWPDGDAPENPTADDVRAKLNAHGPVDQVINDWALDSFGNDWEVYPNG